MDKFRLYGESRIENISTGAITLYRIVADKDFGNITSGTTGGWVESIDNLSQLGDCWIYENAKVYGAATVTGNAQVKGNAHVFGNAIVTADNIIIDGDDSINSNITMPPVIIDGYLGGDIMITDTDMRIGLSTRTIDEWIEFHNTWKSTRSITSDDFFSIVGREPEENELEFDWWDLNGAKTIRSAMNHAASVVA